MIQVPLAKKVYTSDEMCLFRLFGVRLQPFVVSSGETWVAPIALISKAQAAVRDFQAGRGTDPSKMQRALEVKSIRVPYAQEKIGPELARLYEALTLETVDLVVSGADGRASTITALIDHVEEVSAFGPEALIEPGEHVVPLTAISLLAYYTEPPPLIIQTLARFCEVPYCRLTSGRRQYWLAALGGEALLNNVIALGLCS